MPEQYPDPPKTGLVPFTPPGTNIECLTSFSLWGDLDSGIPPLICLHGGPGCPSQYLKPLGMLHEQHHIPVLTYDQIGSGHSTHLRDKRGNVEFWTLDLFLSQLNNLLSSLSIKRYDILGKMPVSVTP